MMDKDVRGVKASRDPNRPVRPLSSATRKSRLLEVDALHQRKRIANSVLTSPTSRFSFADPPPPPIGPTLTR
jgi:hypothetical protein